MGGNVILRKQPTIHVQLFFILSISNYLKSVKVICSQMTNNKHVLFIETSWTALTTLSNSYTMGCPPVRGDNPRALASGLSYVQVDKDGITILYHLHQCIPFTSRDILC